MLQYHEGIAEAKKRKNDVTLASALILELVKVGICSSHQQSAWRVVNLPECPIAVQLEFDEQHVDIIPLSAYTESLGTSFPLAPHSIPHHVRLKLSTPDDIHEAVQAIANCFPQHRIEHGKNTKRQPTKKSRP